MDYVLEMLLSEGFVDKFLFGIVIFFEKREFYKNFFCEIIDEISNNQENFIVFFMVIKISLDFGKMYFIIY